MAAALKEAREKRRKKGRQRVDEIPGEDENLGRGRRNKIATDKRLSEDVFHKHERADIFRDLVGLETHWHEKHPDYIAAKKRYQDRQLWEAVDKLEGLVVRRLFELQKCHVMGTSKCAYYLV